MAPWGKLHPQDEPVGSHACGERATPALRNAGTDRVGFSLSGRVLSLSLSISRDIPVASIP